jgi:murein DD-endopeptidase MepM/ murein hydrolase activator NlpD/Na+-transporting methylmalonyl-CoA/oxaloacetate decarboxylase gamma subunit
MGEKLYSKAFGRKSERGIGAAVVFLLIVLLAIFILLVAKVASRQAPAILVLKSPKGLGQKTELVVEASDPKHDVKTVTVEVVQNGKVVHLSSLVLAPQPHHWWKFWSARPVSATTWHVLVGRQVAPELKEGRATVHIAALNDSWGRFFRGGRSELSLDLPVRFAPPQVEMMTTQHYINQGGCDMAVFHVSPGTTESGVKVGDDFFPSFPMKESQPELRLCLFAIPYDADTSVVPQVLARDDAGNQTLVSFNYKIFPKKFHTDTIDLDKVDGGKFLEKVVPPIMSQLPDLADQGSLLKNFLQINGPLRQEDARKLVDLSHNTAQTFLWKGPFIRLPGKTEASFADYRTYLSNGQPVDHQTHLGFDLAGSEHMPVRAANDGNVVFAGFLDIFGNAVVIDHGCGLQSLYGHLSFIGVKVGDHVTREQEIGRSGQTGLAAGDHLHFTMLLDGMPINPVEWWDPHWIHDRIEVKMQ